MKLFQYTILVFLLWQLSSCDDPITVDLDSVDPFLCVDAWLTHTDSTQKIVLTYTQDYFNNLTYITATGATVTVTDTDTNEVYAFTDEDNDGTYIWTPQPGVPFGDIGHSYHLLIAYDSVEYTADSQMNPAPPVDSITYEYHDSNALVAEDYYIGQFWARDLEGAGNTYWIKTFKNGEFLDDPDEINLAYDASTSSGAEVDGLIFIQPIRLGMNPYDDDGDNGYLPPYSNGDVAEIQIHAITYDAWFFLSRVQEETDRSGGFAELFATPLANVPTNLTASEEDADVVGFFSVASVTSLTVPVDQGSIRDGD